MNKIASIEARKALFGIVVGLVLIVSLIVLLQRDDTAGTGGGANPDEPTSLDGEVGSGSRDSENRGLVIEEPEAGSPRETAEATDESDEEELSLRGLVQLPDGSPAPAATVSLFCISFSVNTFFVYVLVG